MYYSFFTACEKAIFDIAIIYWKCAWLKMMRMKSISLKIGQERSAQKGTQNLSPTRPIEVFLKTQKTVVFVDYRLHFWLAKPKMGPAQW